MYWGLRRLSQSCNGDPRKKVKTIQIYHICCRVMSFGKSTLARYGFTIADVCWQFWFWIRCLMLTLCNTDLWGLDGEILAHCRPSGTGKAISASHLPPQTCLDHSCTTHPVYGWHTHCPWDMLHTLPQGLLLQERFWCPSSRTQSPLSPDSGWRGLDRSHLAGKRGWAFKTPHVNFLNHTAWLGQGV